MADLIKIRKGNKAKLPILQDGEFGYTKDSNELFIGTQEGNKVPNQGKFDEINTKLDNVSGQLADTIQQNNKVEINVLNPPVPLVGCTCNGVVDDAIAINNIINALPQTSVFLFPKGEYTFKSKVAINRVIKIKGVGSNLTVFNRPIDTICLEFIGETGKYLSLSSLGLEGVTINGDTGHTKDLIRMEYIARASFKDVVLNRSGGNGLYMRSVQDCVFENMYFRYCGKQFTGNTALFMDSFIYNSNENVNDNKFINCTFEHNTGQLIKSIGEFNNSNVFMGCKFEYNNEGTPQTNSPIILQKTSRFQFDNCRFTHYSTCANGLFEITDSYDITLNGSCFNSINPTKFGSIINSHNIKIDVNGRKCGGVTKTGNTYYIQENVFEKENNSDFVLLEKVNEYANVDIRNMHYSDEGAKIEDYADGVNGCIIKGSDKDYQKVIMVKINKQNINKDGLTIYFKAKSSSSKAYELRVRKLDGEIYNINITSQLIGITESLYKVSIPNEYLKSNTYFIINNGNAQAGINLYISELYFENKYYVNSIPVSGKWSIGDKVYNSSPTSGSYEGWICTTSGTPGTWKGFGLIQS